MVQHDSIENDIHSAAQPQKQEDKGNDSNAAAPSELAATAAQISTMSSGASVQVPALVDVKALSVTVPSGDLRPPASADCHGQDAVAGSPPSGARLLWSKASSKVRTNISLSQKFTTLRDMTGQNFVEPKQLKAIKDLGCGAFARVTHELYTPESGTAYAVAVKRLLPGVTTNVTDLEDLQKEVNLLRKLRHSNIVSYVGCGYAVAGAAGTADTSAEASSHSAAAPTDSASANSSSQQSVPSTTAASSVSGPVVPGSLFLVEEFLDGGTLKSLLMKQMVEPYRLLYSYKDALRWMLQVAKGLRYLHQARPMVIHRDLKPENILLKGPTPSQQEAKISDFGLVALVHKPEVRRSQNLTSTGQANQLSEQDVEELEERWSQRARNAANFARAASSGLQRTGSRVTGKKANMYRSPTLQLVQDLSGQTGSLMYMAPEVYKCEPYNDKADVFSFGVILREVFARYMMLVAISIRGTEDEVEAYAMRVSNGYRPPLLDTWPQELKDIIEACWAQDPLQRPSMDKVVNMLVELSHSNVADEMDAAAKKGDMNCFACSGCCVM